MYLEDPFASRARLRAFAKHPDYLMQIAFVLIIGDVRVAFRLCFKASPSAKPFIWKLVLLTCK